MRLRTAPALLVVGTALLVVGNAVYLLQHPAQTLVERTPFDATAAGGLLRYRVIVRAPDVDERAMHHSDGKAWIEVGVRWQDDVGAAHERWWRSSEDVDLWSLAELRLWPLARSIGLPWREFQIPEEAATAWRDVQGRLDWTAIDIRPSGNDEALLKRWVDDEQQAHREVPLAALISLLVTRVFVAVIAGARGLFGDRIGIGAALMLAVGTATRIPGAARRTDTGARRPAAALDGGACTRRGTAAAAGTGRLRTRGAAHARVDHGRAATGLPDRTVKLRSRRTDKAFT